MDISHLIKTYKSITYNQCQVLEPRKILQSFSMSLKHLKLSLFSFNSGTNLFDDPLASLWQKQQANCILKRLFFLVFLEFLLGGFWIFSAKILLFLEETWGNHLFFESSSNTFEIQHLFRSLSADPRYTCKMLHSETIWYAILASLVLSVTFGTSPAGLQFHRILHFYGIFDYINHNTSTTQCRYTVYIYSLYTLGTSGIEIYKLEPVSL